MLEEWHDPLNSKVPYRIMTRADGTHVIVSECFMRMVECRWWDDRKWYEYLGIEGFVDALPQ